MVAEVRGDVANPEPPPTAEQALGVGIRWATKTSDLVRVSMTMVHDGYRETERLNLFYAKCRVACSNAFPLSRRERVEHGVVRVN